jgi:hypothetical protein
MNKLEQYLDIHVRWMKEAACLVPPGEDLSPLLSFADKNNHMAMLPMPSGGNLSEWARDTLEDMEAVIYATVMAAYVVPLDQLEKDVAERLEPLVVEHGTGHPEVLPYRQECYIVSAGDRSGTLMSVFFVKRGEDGRVRQLVEREGPPGHWAGPLTDLLMTRH